MRKHDYFAWQEEGTWVVHSPSVPGVYGLGKTRRHAEADFVEALGEMLAYLKEIAGRTMRPRPLRPGK